MKIITLHEPGFPPSKTTEIFVNMDLVITFYRDEDKKETILTPIAQQDIKVHETPEEIKQLIKNT